MEPASTPEYCLLMIDHWSTCMDKGQWASWAQAFFSVAAIAIAVWVTSRQMRHDAGLYRKSQADERQRVALALAHLAHNSFGLLCRIQSHLADRQAVHDAAEGDRLPFHLPELDAIEAALSAIPFHDLPAELVSPAMSTAYLVRKFRACVQIAFATYRTMDSDAFDNFFSTLADVVSTLEKVVNEIPGTGSVE